MTVDVTKPAEVPCPICAGRTEILDVVDFNKSCLEKDGRQLQACGKPIYYNRCPDCGFILAPEMWGWSREDFVRLVYNDDYAVVDPDYADVRPRYDLEIMLSMFPSGLGEAEHLDYGSGGGLLVDLLRERGWRSTPYDPLVHGENRPARRFGLITAFEVFEHVPSLDTLMGDLKALAVEDEAIILFTTMVSDPFIDPMRRLDWWYASPRNGHISLYSYDSLKRLAIGAGWGFASFSNVLHCFCTRPIPAWAHHVIRAGP